MQLWSFTWFKTGTGWAAEGGLFNLEDRDGQWVFRYRAPRFESKPCQTMVEAIQQVLGPPIVVLGHTFYPIKMNLGLYQAQSEDLPALRRVITSWDACVPGFPDKRYSNLGSHATPEGVLEMWFAGGLAAAQYKLDEGLKGVAKWRKLMRASK